MGAVVKNKLLSSVAAVTGLLSFTGAGLAADLPLKAARALPVQAPNFSNWGGLYLGGHAVYGDTQYSTEFASPSGKKNYSTTTGVSGFGAGLHAGYNFQSGQWVYGVEGDVTITPWENNQTTFVSPSGKKRHDATARLDALATIRGRLGLSFGRSLVYATGGVAFAQGKYQLVINEDKKSPQTFGGRNNDVGAVAGGGIEWKYNPNLSLRVEGLYYFSDRKSTENVKQDAKGATTLTHGLQDIAVVRVCASGHY